MSGIYGSDPEDRARERELDRYLDARYAGPDYGDPDYDDEDLFDEDEEDEIDEDEEDEIDEDEDVTTPPIAPSPSPKESK